MGAIRRYRSCRAPLGRVWEMVADPFNFPGWMSGVSAVRRLSNDEVGVGFRFAPVLSVGPVPARVDAEITALWPHVMLGLAGKGPGTSFGATLRLMETPEGTGIELAVDYSYRAWWARLFGPLVAAQARAWMETSLLRLTALAEASCPPPVRTRKVEPPAEI